MNWFKKSQQLPLFDSPQEEPQEVVKKETPKKNKLEVVLMMETCL